MIVVHHLSNSRSQRILWALEELALPCEIKRYHRDAQTNLARPELKQVHPLGKSPVITDGNRTIIDRGRDYRSHHPALRNGRRIRKPWRRAGHTPTRIDQPTS